MCKSSLFSLEPEDSLSVTLISIFSFVDMIIFL